MTLWGVVVLEERGYMRPRCAWVATLSSRPAMELERLSQAEREQDTSVEVETSSDEEESDTILNQNGLPLDQISSVPSSRFSGEIATLRRDWEHISGVVSEHLWSENEEDERTPFYVSDSEGGRLSNSVFLPASLPDRYSDGSSGLMNENIDGELDRAEEDGGIEDDVGGARALELSYYDHVQNDHIEDGHVEDYHGDDRSLELSHYDSVEEDHGDDDSGKDNSGDDRSLELSHYDNVEEDHGDDGGEEDHGEDRAVKLSCEVEDKDDLISQLQEQLRSEQASKQYANDVNKSLQQEYERVRKRLAECEMHIDRLRLEPSANGMPTKTVTLVYEDVPSPASGGVINSDLLPASGDEASSNHTPTSGVMADSQLVPSRSRTPDGGSIPPPVRPSTRQQSRGTPPTVKGSHQRDRQRKQSSTLLPMDVVQSSQRPVEVVQRSCSEEGAQPVQGRTEKVPFASQYGNQSGSEMHQENRAEYSVQDGKVESDALDRRADELVAEILSSSSLTSSSVLQLVSEMSNCGSIAGFLVEDNSDGLSFTFSQESLLHSNQCEGESAGNAEQARGRTMLLTQASTPVMSVNQSEDRQLLQTSGQPKPSRLREPRARYRQPTLPSPADESLNVNETNDAACALEGSLYCGHVTHKPSRIPVRDPAYLLRDTPTTTHCTPINQQQELDRPVAYANTAERTGMRAKSTGNLKSGISGGREEADVRDQVDVAVETTSVEGYPLPPALLSGGSTLSKKQLEEETPIIGRAQPVSFHSHLAQGGTNSFTQPTGELAEGRDLVALHKQLAAVQEELRRLTSLHQPQAVIERRSSASSDSLSPSSCRQRTPTDAAGRRGSSGNHTAASIEQVAMVAASPPHSRRNSQLPRVTEAQLHSVSSHQPEVHTAHSGVHIAKREVLKPRPDTGTTHSGVNVAGSGTHTAHPSLRAPHSDVHSPHPQISAAHPNAHVPHTEMSERGTSPLHTKLASPMTDCGTSPIYSETAHSGTVPRTVSRGTVHKPKVGCGSNTVMCVTRGTDPDELPTDSLVRDEVEGFATNEKKQSCQQKRCSRLRCGSVQCKDPVLSEEEGRTSREVISSSEAGTTPAKVSVHSPVGFNTKPLNQEDLAKMYHVLHKAGLYGPLTELTEDGVKVTDQGVQCNVDPPRISPDCHSGRGGGHSHQEVGGGQLHETTLPLPRHMSTPHSKFPQGRRHRQRDCSQTSLPPHRRRTRHRRPREPSDTDSGSSMSGVFYSASATGSESPADFKLRRRMKDSELKEFICGNCGSLDRGCDLHLTKCRHNANHRPGNHRVCPDHHGHHSCRKCNTYDYPHGSSRHRRHGHHNFRRTSRLSHKFHVEGEPSRRASTVNVYGDTVLVSPSKLCTRSHPSRSPERPYPAMAACQSPPSRPPCVYDESRLNEACRLADKLKQHSRRMEWDLSLSISRNCSHSLF